MIQNVHLACCFNVCTVLAKRRNSAACVWRHPHTPTWSRQFHRVHWVSFISCKWWARLGSAYIHTDRLRPYTITFERIRLSSSQKISGVIIMIISQAGAPLQSVSTSLSCRHKHLWGMSILGERSQTQRHDFNTFDLKMRAPFLGVKSALYPLINPLRGLHYILNGI